MAEIEHTISDYEDAEVELGEEFCHGFFLRFSGDKSAIKIYVDYNQLQTLFDRLCEFGFEPPKEAT